MWSDAKRSHCYYHDVDYFLITAHPEAFYSSSIKDRDTFCVFIATVVECLRNKFLLTSEQLYNTSISYSIIVLYKESFIKFSNAGSGEMQSKCSSSYVSRSIHNNTGTRNVSLKYYRVQKEQIYEWVWSKQVLCSILSIKKCNEDEKHWSCL